METAQGLTASPYYQSHDIAIFNTDFINTNQIEPESIDLVVTSPPYNVEIFYGSIDDNCTYEDYLHYDKHNMNGHIRWEE